VGLGTPSSGGRILLVRSRPDEAPPASTGDPDAASGTPPPDYEVELRAAGVVWRSRARLTEPDWQVSFSEWSRVEAEAAPPASGSDGSRDDAPTDPPDWLRAGAAGLLRTLARQAERTGRWPRRIHRWRRARHGDGDGDG